MVAEVIAALIFLAGLGAGVVSGARVIWFAARPQSAASSLARHGAAIRRVREAAKRDATHRALREAVR